MPVNRKAIDITPETRIGELLEAYPDLEAVLVAMAPAFARLRNPVLRRTVARVATLRQAATIGGTPLATMVNDLRRAAGCEEPVAGVVDTDGKAANPPSWFHPGAVVRTFDARPMLDAGEAPISTVMQALRGLSAGQCLELITPFLPAPLIDAAEKQGYATWSIRDMDLFRTYFTVSART